MPMLVQTFNKSIQTALRRAARVAGLDWQTFNAHPVIDGTRVEAVHVRVGDVQRTYRVRATAEWARSLVDDAQKGVFGKGPSIWSR